MFVGLWLFALGVVMTLRADLGVAPWDVLHDGLRLRTPLTFGGAVILVGLVLVVLTAASGIRPGIGTISNMLAIGIFEDLMLATEIGADLGDAVVWRAVLLVAGVLTIGLGSALYIGAELGPGPRDGLMVMVAERTGFRIGVSRGLVEGAALAVGFLLGGAAGVGTLLFALGIGPAVDLAFRLFGMDSSGHRARPDVGDE